MRTRRLLVAVGLALVLAAPTGLAQSGVTIDTQAQANGQSLGEASPLEPGTSIDVPTSVSTDADSGTEFRAFVNATIGGGGPSDSRTANWTGTDQVSLDLSLQAPQEEGAYALGWNVTVQSRNATSPSWTEANSESNRVGFQVEKPAPPPSADNVTVTVKTGSGAPLEELGNLTPSQQIILDGNVTLPQRDDLEWNVTMTAFVNGTRVASAQQVSQTGGQLPFVLNFNAPGSTGSHDVSWSVDVDYREQGADTWTDLTTREDSASFTVQTLAPPTEPGLPWGWIIGVGVVAVAGGGGAYYVLREPKQIKGKPKSQAMQDLEGGAAEPETDEAEVHPQVKILEARAEDLRRMIELARERYEDGEITEHQFETIKEKKEAELEEVEEEMEEYRQESAG